MARGSENEAQAPTPWTSEKKAVASINDMIEACTAAVSAVSDLAMAGSVGRYMSIANGPMTESRPSTIAARKIFLSIVELFPARTGAVL